jgi:predicted enzyme related to lactoylglutathione lyase
MRVIEAFVLTASLICLAASGAALVPTSAIAESVKPDVAVGPQYTTTHVYVAPEDVERFVSSFIATFGGTASKQAVTTVTPTPSRTIFQAVRAAVGALSVFGYQTPIPYPFGLERTGYLVADMDRAIRAARSAGASVIVAPFDDPIGRDAVIQWPGGVNMQLYWHTTPPSYPDLRTIPDSRIYVSPDKADEFIHRFAAFARGKIVSDDRHASGIGIGRRQDIYRLVRIETAFGKLTVLVTDGHLPHPYGHELTGYQVEKLSDTLIKAKAAGAAVLAGPYSVDHSDAAIVQFPGGYVAEIHSPEAN